MSLGTVSGAAVAVRKKFDGEMGLIMIDAHGDFHDKESSLSKHFHGMHLEYLTGHKGDKLAQILNATTKMNPENVIVIGCNDLDEGELERMRKKGVKVFPMNERITINKIKKAISEVYKRVKGIWVSYDNDGVSHLASQATPMLNTANGDNEGLSMNDIIGLFNFIRRSCENVVGLDIAEFYPKYDCNSNYITLNLVYYLIEALFVQDPEYLPRLPFGFKLR